MTHSFEKFQEERVQMVDRQIKARGLIDIRLLSVFREVPRHCFVPDHMHDLAYSDQPLPIGYQQTISQPYIVALMTSLMNLSGDEVVLDVGTGSGYQAAILSKLVKQVHSVERIPELAESAARALADLGYDNVQVHCVDGSLGWPEGAPYDAIVVGAAAPQAPLPLLQQLVEGGRLVLPVGSRIGQELQVWVRYADRFDSEGLIPVSFVPLRGKHGWQEERWQ